MPKTPTAPPVVVHHPDVPDLVHTVPAENVAEWVEAGWKRVKRADEAEVIAQIQGP